MTKEPDLSAVDARYHSLYERAIEVLGSDERVVRVEIHGSLANGTADEWSDLDLKVIVHDEDAANLCEEWESWMAAITPTVYCDRPLAPFIVNAVTADGLTLDVSVWRESAPEWVPPPGFTVGLISGRRYTQHAPAIQYAVEERLRGLAGPLIRFLKRGDYLALLGGLGHMLNLLTTVMLAEVDAVAADPRHPERYLSDEQRVVLTSLPRVAVDFESLLAFELALAEQTLTRARPLFAKFGLEWPVALEAVAAANLERHLGVTVAWLRPPLEKL